MDNLKEKVLNTPNNKNNIAPTEPAILQKNKHRIAL